MEHLQVKLSNLFYEINTGRHLVFIKKSWGQHRKQMKEYGKDFENKQRTGVNEDDMGVCLHRFPLFMVLGLRGIQKTGGKNKWHYKIPLQKIFLQTCLRSFSHFIIIINPSHRMYSRHVPNATKMKTGYLISPAFFSMP